MPAIQQKKFTINVPLPKDQVRDESVIEIPGIDFFGDLYLGNKAKV